MTRQTGMSGSQSACPGAVACLLAGLLWHLPDDIGGVLVVPQALEPRVTELSRRWSIR